MNTNRWANDDGQCCSSCGSWFCSETAKALAQSIGNIGAAYVTAKTGKNKNQNQQQPNQTTNNKDQKKIFTAKNIAIGSVIGIIVIAGIAGGIWIAKNKK